MARLKTLRPQLATLKLPLERPASAGHGWAREGARESSSARGYGAAWRQLRAEILRRDKGLCQPCQEKGLVRVAHAVDHIIPKAAGGTDDPKNLRAICESCHREKTAAEGAAGRGW